MILFATAFVSRQATSPSAHSESWASFSTYCRSENRSWFFSFQRSESVRFAACRCEVNSALTQPGSHLPHPEERLAVRELPQLRPDLLKTGPAVWTFS